MVRELRFVSPDRLGPMDGPARITADRGGGGPDPRARDASAKAALLAAISRDMRTTLALVSGYSQTVLHLDLDDKERARCLTRISLATERVAELTNEMLSLTASQDDGRPACQPIAISGLLSLLSRQFAEEGGAPRLIAQIPAELPLVNADPLWILNVLRILVATIGIGSTEERPVQIEARTIGEWVVVSAQSGDGPRSSTTASARSPSTQRGRGASSPKWTALSRERTGPTSHRFDPRVSSEDSGAGPALDLCRQLIEAHGGWIWIDELASGTRVSFALPRYWPEAGKAERRHRGGLRGGLIGAIER